MDKIFECVQSYMPGGVNYGRNKKEVRREFKVGDHPAKLGQQIMGDDDRFEMREIFHEELDSMRDAINDGALYKDYINPANRLEMIAEATYLDFPDGTSDADKRDAYYGLWHDVSRLLREWDSTSTIAARYEIASPLIQQRIGKALEVSTDLVEYLTECEEALQRRLKLYNGVH